MQTLTIKALSGHLYLTTERQLPQWREQALKLLSTRGKQWRRIRGHIRLAAQLRERRKVRHNQPETAKLLLFALVSSYGHTKKNKLRLQPIQHPRKRNCLADVFDAVNHLTSISAGCRSKTLPLCETATELPACLCFNKVSRTARSQAFEISSPYLAKIS